MIGGDDQLEEYDDLTEDTTEEAPEGYKTMAQRTVPSASTREETPTVGIPTPREVQPKVNSYRTINFAIATIGLFALILITPIILGCILILIGAIQL